MVSRQAHWATRTGHRFTSPTDSLSIDVLAEANYASPGAGGEGGIASVVFTINGVAQPAITSRSRRRPNYNTTKNPETGTTQMQDFESFGFTLSAADWPNGTITITAEVTTGADNTVALGAIKVYNNKDADTRPSNKVIYVSPTGNNSNDGLTELTPVLGVQKGFELAATNGNLGGSEVVLLTGTHTWSGYSFGMETNRYTSDHWWSVIRFRPGAKILRDGATTPNGNVAWSGGGSDTLFLIPDTGAGHEDNLRLLLIQEDENESAVTGGSLPVWTGGSTTTVLHVEGGRVSHPAHHATTNRWSVRFTERNVRVFEHIAGGGAGPGRLEATNVLFRGVDNSFLGYSYTMGCKVMDWIGITYQTTNTTPSILACNTNISGQRYDTSVNGLIDCEIDSGVEMQVLDANNLRIQQSLVSDVNPLGDFGNPSESVFIPDISLHGAELSLSAQWGVGVYNGTTIQSGLLGLEVIDSGTNGTGPYIDIRWDGHGYGSSFSLVGWRIRTLSRLRDNGSGGPYPFVDAVHPDVWQAYAAPTATMFCNVRIVDCLSTRIWSASESAWDGVVMVNCGDTSFGNISDIQPPSMVDCLFIHCTFGATVDFGSLSATGNTEFRRCVFVDVSGTPTGATFDGNHFVNPGEFIGTNYTTGSWFLNDPLVSPYSMTPALVNQGQATGNAVHFSEDYVFEGSGGASTAGVWLDVAEAFQLPLPTGPEEEDGGGGSGQLTNTMATTTTALGSVPQLIVDAGTTVLTASFATLVEMDTHGAEFIGFQMEYVKGGETGVSLTLQAKLITDGSWVTLPILPTRAETSDTASASRAFQAYVGREVNALRIQGKVTAGTDNSTKTLKVWGLLSAPTFPIIGSTI